MRDDSVGFGPVLCSRYRPLDVSGVGDRASAVRRFRGRAERERNRLIFVKMTGVCQQSGLRRRSINY